MKYAKEVIELMSAYPERRFKKKEIIRYLTKSYPYSDKNTLRVGASRIIDQLIEMGCVNVFGEKKERVSCAYSWKKCSN